MLRIHVEETATPAIVTLRLEGKVIQPWVEELARSWTKLRERFPNKAQIQVDLNAVSFVDEDGQCLLRAMSREGGLLRGSGAYTGALIHEIVLETASLSQAFQANAQHIAEAGLPPEDEIRALTFALVRHFHDHPSALPLFVRSRSVFDWEVESKLPPTLSNYEAGRVQLQRCLTKLAGSGLLRPLPLEFLTELYLDILQACLQFNFRHCNNEEVHVCVGRAIECFLHGAGERR